MHFHRIRSFVWQLLGILLLFLLSPHTTSADPPLSFPWPAETQVGDGLFSSTAVDASDFSGLAASGDSSGPQPLSPSDPLGAAGEYAEQPATYLHEATSMELYDAPRDLPFSCVDELCEALKRRDAAATSSAEYGRGMTLVLDEKGKKYIRFLTWAQSWAAFTDNNPGTVDAFGELKDTSLDLGIRRARFLTYSQLTEKYLILMHVGINNQTFTNGGGSGAVGIGGYGAGKKPQVFIHDVWNEYAVIPASECSDFSLAIGAGLHYWNGVSRKASASTLGFMALDAPTFAWQNIEFSDQFARQLGWYAKGKFHKLDYRFAVNHPFNTDDRLALNRQRAVNIASHSLAYAGYFDWQFWDQESNLLPYKTSTWLGEKSVFNIGAGFYVHPDASGILDADGQLQKQDQLAVGIDCYFDKPVGDEGAAVTMYGVYYIYDYGDNYFRNVGIMNTGQLGSPDFLAAQGITPAISGAGNMQPLLGTGQIFYLEGGYLLPKWVLGESHGRLQPFGAFTHKSLDWLDDPAFNWDMGLNYLIDGHRAKLTFQYSLRPLFFQQGEGETTRRVSDGSRGEFVIQAQVAL